LAGIVITIRTQLVTTELHQPSTKSKF